VPPLRQQLQSTLNPLEADPAVTALGEFGMRHERTSAGDVLWLTGEMDLPSAGLLEASIAELCDEQVDAIVLELGELSFMSSTGLRALLASQEMCRAIGCRFSLGSLSPQVSRVLELSGVGRAIIAGQDAGG
jgi:anti-anti-sigma factor